MRPMWTPPALWKHLSIRSMSMLAIVDQDQRIWNRWNRSIGVEERVNPSTEIKDSLLPNVVTGGNSFICSMLCKSATSIADSTWVICPWKPSWMPILVVSCLNSGHMQDKMLNCFSLPTIQVGWHLAATCRLLICPPWTPKSSVKAWWIALLIMEDIMCSLPFAKWLTQISSMWQLIYHVLLTHCIKVIVPPIKSQK